MNLKYCPECGSLDMIVLGAKNARCKRCSFAGEAFEGAMDEINAFRKKLVKKEIEWKA